MGWRGLKEEEFEVKKRSGSKRAYALRGCASMFKGGSNHMTGKFVISIEVLGKTDEKPGRMFTLGDTVWTKHYSPMIGRLAGTKNFEAGEGGKPKSERYE